MTAPGLTCPSGRARPGAQLFALRGADGKLRHLGKTLAVSDAASAEMRRQGNPEAHMRFAEPCQQHRCTQWTGGGCGLVGRLLAMAPEAQEGAAGRCAIRGSCRWFSQEGWSACAMCPEIATDSRGTPAAAGA